jgi:flagellar assembly protein FliH
MNKIILKIPPRKSKIKIIKNEELIRREFERKLLELEALTQKEPEVAPESQIIEEVQEEIVVPQPKITYFTETYTISDSNEPIEIDLRRLPDESIPVEEAAKEVQAAYDRGFADGQDSARAIYQAEIQLHTQWIKRFDKIAFELKKAFLQEQQKFNDALIKLALEISRQIIGFTAIESEKLVTEQINRVFSELKDEEIFKIELNPDDLDVLKNVKSNIINFTENNKIEVIANQSLERGSCLLHTSAGIIDGRISTQIKRIQQALIEAAEEIKLDLEATLKESYPDILDTIMPEVKPLENETTDEENQDVPNS